MKNKIDYLKQMKELLITIDMVNGFVKEVVLAAGSIARIIPRQQELLDEALKNNTGLIFIRDSHPANAEEFKTYPVHCLEGGRESMLVDELKKYEDQGITYLKNSTSLLFAPNIQEDLLKMKELQKVRVMGCLSEVCVQNGSIDLKNFFNQYNKDIDIIVHADAIDTYDSIGHNRNKVTDNALKTMASNGIKILGKRL